MMSRIVMMCCRKLSCLLLVVTTKSCRTISGPHAPHVRLTEGGIGEYDARPLPRIGDESVAYLDERVAIRSADAVKKQIHGGESTGAVDQFVAGREMVA